MDTDKTRDLWRAIGAVDALSNPDGTCAENLTPQERLDRIWETVKDLRPEQS